MRILILVLLLGLALLLESTVLEFIRVAGVKPDLVLVLVVYYAIFNGPREGAFLGFLGGLAHDFLSGYYLGLNALAVAASGYVVGLGHIRLFKENHFVVAGIAFLATILVEGIRYLLLLFLGVTILPGEAWWGLIIPSGVYNAAVALLFHRRFYLSSTRGLLRIP
ncbi:rod shape-determining protein MreD [Candidatus Desulforudis audaxviator]|uniref:Uncharacterized protein n=1 Tax=Desulforudis audaxviator (strain MP104C) TaxID=477974 RepID=B1I4Q2_DESAP|nr:rod shape-determining protein MreD [Candidatus Desulforudis audaxviator]ACA59970.1 conserved hypothetical protein [Candidatus Desulforudis audaxviator MP104C]AZK59986.1 Rod shape-determining protein MreD [Candidatus Desulforudis audaxviator]